MSQFFKADFEARVARLRQRLHQAEAILKDEIEIPKLELSTHLLANSIRSVRELTSATEKQDFDEDTCKVTAELLIKADDVMVELSICLQNLRPEILQQQQMKQPQSVHVTQQNHLEIKVPIFDGDRTKYQAFKKAIEIVCNRKNPSPEERLLFLTQHLAKGPANTVKNIPCTEDGYNLAWKLLDQDYDDAARIRNDIFNQLTRMAPASDNPSSLKDTLDQIEAHLRVLETYEKEEDEVNNNETYRRLVLAKFPRTVIRHISPLGETPSLKDARKNLRIAINSEIEVQTLIEPISSISVEHQIITAPLLAASKNKEVKDLVAEKTDREKRNDTRRNDRNDSQKITCKFCSKSHYSSDCKMYETAEARKNALPPDACIICLRTGHSRQKCSSRGQCYFCRNRTHNSAFCPSKFGFFSKRPENKANRNESNPQKATVTESKKVNEPSKTNINLIRTYHGSHITARANVVNPVTKTTCSARILFDMGCPETFILETKSAELELISQHRNDIQVTTFGSNEYRNMQSNTVNFNIETQNGIINIYADTAPLIQEDIHVFEIEEFKRKFPQYANYSFVDPANNEPIDILIGNDHLFEILDMTSQIEVQKGLFILKSSLGWLLGGRMEKSSNKRSTVMLATKKAIETLWTLDTIGITDLNHSQSKEEEIALAEFEQNIRYEEGRYTVAFPWKYQPSDLPSNYALARGVLTSLLKRYQDRPQYLQTCDSIFQQQLANGIIEEVPGNSQETSAHYLPFHLVIQPEKSTKVRIVYNGSAKSSKQHLSLNDCLYKGTNLLTQIPAIILRSLLYRIMLIADVEAAYHTLGLHEHDRNYLRFVWVRNYTAPKEQQIVSTYRFARIPFGIITSAFLLAATIYHHLKKYKRVYRKLFRNIYSDNMTTGFETLEEAKLFFQEIIAIFRAAGMNLRQWNSNDEIFLQGIPTVLRDHNINIKVLGIHWNTRNDIYRIPAPKEFDFHHPTTLRRVLKSTSQAFDPMGWAAPITITARTFIQKLHSQKKDWDTPLTKEDSNEWKELFRNLRQINTIIIQRFISQYDEPTAAYSYHVFTDASKKAFACAVYLRIQTKEKISVHLLYARARVAPITEMSIPRLEIMAALIGIRALQYVKEALPLPVVTPSIVWIDSKCVLHWIHKGIWFQDS